MGLSENRLILLDEPAYPLRDVPEAAVEECLKVLRTLRDAAVENADHEADIISSRAINLLVLLAQKHNREITDANSQPNETGGQPSCPNADLDLADE